MLVKPKEIVLSRHTGESCAFCEYVGELRPIGACIQMLMSCFQIKLIDPSGGGALCETCVSRLRDATTFRAQVEAAGVLLQNIEDDNSAHIENEYKNILEHKIKPESGNIVKVKGEKEFTTFPASDDFDVFSEEKLSNDVSEKQKDEQTIIFKDDIVKLNKYENLSEKDPWSEEETDIKDGDRIEWRYQKYFPAANSFKGPKLEKKTNKCPVCKQEFANRKKLVKHYNFHFPQHLCHLCGKVFAQGLKKHIETHQEKKLKKHLRQDCPQCNKSFSCRDVLVQHINVKHKNKKLFRCPQCETRFKNYFERSEHLLHIHGVWYNKHPCPECNKNFYNSTRLDMHMRSMHLKEKTRPCPECGRLFFGKQALQNHVSSHSDVRNFVCDVCGKGFKFKKTLTEHLKIHSNIRGHRCSQCDKGFIQSSGLKSHLRTHHKNISATKLIRHNLKTKDSAETNR